MVRRFKPENGSHSTLDVHLGMSLSEVKRELLLQTLKSTGGNKAKTAADHGC